MEHSQSNDSTVCHKGTTTLFFVVVLYAIARCISVPSSQKGDYSLETLITSNVPTVHDLDLPTQTDDLRSIADLFDLQ